MAKPTESDPLADTAAAEPSDPLAQTAAQQPGPALGETATGAPRIPPATGAPTTIARYRIDGQLGEGAMGVVYAAHDPDLERRVAIKVLRGVGSDPARARLLREARAMARLSHPAVVTVHEVGTEAGIDYVAMELIDGSTLAEWIARAKPPAAQILEAFEAAGRGLASAHAAGVVHRDFKPHNVLRSKRGRVVVTDFGLARASLDEPRRPSDAAIAASRDRGSLSSTLTATGAVMGTPAYMAPEQHDGAEVGPAADQFAYCVALWEALAGSRPFSGETLGELRRHIDRGPDPSSEAKIPRRLRGALRRGLAVDPAARFPTIDALLAVIHRRRGRMWAFVAAGAVAIAAVMFAVVARSHDTTPAILAGCGDPDTELANVIRSPARAKLAATVEGTRLLDHVDAYRRDWIDAQRAICADPADVEHARRVTCLRAVRADLERTLAGLAQLTTEELEDSDASIGIGDPRTCTATPRAPNRVVIDDPAAVAIVAGANGTSSRRQALAEPSAATPCLRGMYFMSHLRGYATLAFATTATYKAAIAEAADRCGDDRFSASVTSMLISTDAEALLRDPTASARIDAAVARSGGDRSLTILRELVDGIQARYRADNDAVIVHLGAAAELGLSRGIRELAAASVGLAVASLAQRAAPGDLDRAEALLRRAVDQVTRRHRAALQRQLFALLYSRGKLADAMRIADSIHDPTNTTSHGAPVHGRVVDESGKPVANARVVAGEHVMFYGDALDPIAPAAQTAMTTADGSFTLAAPKDSWIVAAAGARRTLPIPAAPQVELRVHPTGSVYGRVVATGSGIGRLGVSIAADGDHLGLMGVLAPDGTWRIDGVPTGKALLVVDYGAVRRQHRQTAIVVGPAPIGPIELEVAIRGEPIHVVVRVQVDVALSMAYVWVVRGPFTGTHVRDIDQLHGDVADAWAMPVRPEDAPAALATTLRSGDVVTRLAAIAPGAITICAVGVTGNLGDIEAGKRLAEHFPELELTCVPTTVANADQVVVIEVPPMKRLR